MVEHRTSFWDRVDRNGENGCWLWTGYIGPKGYGSYSNTGAHRVAWKLNGKPPIPKGMCLDHLCRVRRCVNPDHLEIVTYAENIKRGERFSDKCAQGHLYTDATTKIMRGGWRRCMICYAAARAQRLARRRAQRIQNEGLHATACEVCGDGGFLGVAGIASHQQHCRGA